MLTFQGDELFIMSVIPDLRTDEVLDKQVGDWS